MCFVTGLVAGLTSVFGTIGALGGAGAAASGLGVAGTTFTAGQTIAGAFTAATALASAAGAGIGLASQQQASEYNAEMLRRNAQISETQALQKEEAGRQAELQQRRRISQIKGTQRAGFGASGALVDTGSAFDVLTDTTKFGELDALTIRHNAAKDAWASRVQAGSYRAQANLAGSQAAFANPIFGIGTSLLGSASNLYSRSLSNPYS